ncbi:hypothetical protein G4Y73_00280 [Wenzhouxiangella sp. XN201]|uniref:hypothetical protein n=1 Tax=Wenzhouxiangella sp. XN201 TaxID=2710755 RepID=UPI0013C7609D|nr:hypothetical protein [Wenzhouxiangella sp. XN201]NEZ02580.1 hypothetical protein [Wenzhouxiangella sp. XN201]
MHAFLALCLLLFCATDAPAQSPYAGEEQRRIKSLSPERIEALEAGHGLGYAKAAELNGYPGPRHVLDLADELSLSERQRARTQALFESMQARASELGRELIAAEAELDRAFAERKITSKRLGELLADSARIEGELRRVHLQAHLDQVEMLDEAQVAEYLRLRGYGKQAGAHSHQHQH